MNHQQQSVVADLQRLLANCGAAQTCEVSTRLVGLWLSKLTAPVGPASAPVADHGFKIWKNPNDAWWNCRARLGVGGQGLTPEEAVRDWAARNGAKASAPVAGEEQERIEQMALNRYRTVPCGQFSHKVVAGDGSRSLHVGPKGECLEVAAHLTEAFLDGAFVASSAAPQASEAVRLCIPPAKPLPDLMMASYHEAIGWNECRAAILQSAALSAQPGAQKDASHG